MGVIYLLPVFYRKFPDCFIQQVPKIHATSLTTSAIWATPSQCRCQLSMAQGQISKLPCYVPRRQRGEWLVGGSCLRALSGPPRSGRPQSTEKEN